MNWNYVWLIHSHLSEKITLIFCHTHAQTSCIDMDNNGYVHISSDFIFILITFTSES